MARNHITILLTPPELEALRSALVNVYDGIMPDTADEHLEAVHDYLMDL